MLLEALSQGHAWASTRAKYESSLAAHNIERGLLSVMEAEKQQGMCLSRTSLLSSPFSGIVGRLRSLPSLPPSCWNFSCRFDLLTYHFVILQHLGRYYMMILLQT